MPYVHGANDNASGVGLTLAIGEHYAAKPLANTEVWCVATGARKAGIRREPSASSTATGLNSGRKAPWSSSWTTSAPANSAT